MSPNGGGGWTETFLHSFGSGSDGKNPYATLVSDGSGNLYGTTANGGLYSGGTVFELLPSNGRCCREAPLYSFGQVPSDAQNPRAGLILDSSGNLHGTSVNGGGTGCGGTGCGTVFGIPIRTPFSVLHNFTGGRDGAIPNAGVTVDSAGNLYGTTVLGGNGFGAIYELKLHNGSYLVNSLYNFNGTRDGAYPFDRVVFGPSGALYGTASGGGQNSYGVVFKLRPSPTPCKSVLCSWLETVLYSFTGSSGGGVPLFGDVIFDPAGNMYGTASGGITAGVVWELTPPGTWGAESVLVSFTGPNGAHPEGGVIFDTAGNLYGTTYQGGGSTCCGVVFQLTPGTGGWHENILYNFQGGNDGDLPVASPIFDSAGNLYGAATDGGMNGGGTFFELSPPGTWTFTVLSSLSLTGPRGCPTYHGSYHGPGPWASLAMDRAGNLYGTTCADGAHGFGNVFELSPSGGGWTYIDLYDFTGGSDGGYPVSNVVVDSVGNLYGTASIGGTGAACSGGCGVVWKITQ